MTDEKFWSFIGRLDGQVNQNTAGKLTEALAGTDIGHVEEFAQILTNKMESLDCGLFFGRKVRDVSDPEYPPPAPLLGDALINFHFALIAAGEAQFLVFIDNPEAVTDRVWDFRESDLLAEAVAAAYETIAGRPWPGPLPGYAATEGPSEEAVGSTVPPLPELWLNVALHGTDDIPAPYFDAACALAESINADPHWRTWWSGTDQRDLTIDIEYGALPERSTVTVRKGQAWASFRMQASRFKGRTPGTLAYLAYTDMETVFARVSAELTTGAPPAVRQPANATPPTSESNAARKRLAELRSRHRTRP